MIKIAICDDEQIYIDMIDKVVKKVCESMGVVCEIRHFESGELILSDLEVNEYELILLDIRMPKVGGLEVAEAIYQKTKGDNLIFVTNEEDMVYMVFNFRPLGFVRKHSMERELVECISRWYKNYEKQEMISVVFGREKEEVHIKLKDIMYIEAKKHYVVLHTKKNMFDERASISKYDYLLEKRRFVKCGRSYICNLKYVYNIVDNYMVMNNKDKITISRSCKHEVWKKYNDYQRYKCGRE